MGKDFVRIRLLIQGVLALALALVAIPGLDTRPGLDRTSRQAAPALRLALLGDVMLGRGVAEKHISATWGEVFTVVRSAIAAADLAIANLESPITSVPLVRPGYALRASPASLQALTAAGLDLVTLANNHILDSGAPGLQDTMEALEDASIRWAGPEMQPVVIHIQETSLALLAVDDVSSPLDLHQVQETIRQARFSADYVVLSIHWGIEYTPAPSPREKDIARAMVEAGADIVFGHHPHVLQPVEWVETRDGRLALIAYSLGNAIFDQPTPPSARLGAVLLVELDAIGVSGVQAVPFRIDIGQGILQKADPKMDDIIHRRLSLPPIPESAR